MEVVVEAEDGQGAADATAAMAERAGLVWRGMKITGEAEHALQLLEEPPPPNETEHP